MEDSGEKDKMIVVVDSKIVENATEEEKKLIEQTPSTEEAVDGSNAFGIKSCNITDLVDEISHKIVGQDAAIKSLVSNIYYNQQLIDYLSKDYYIDLAELDSRKTTILLDGPTGTGKTAILKEISSKLDLPIVFCNATSFSETGYVGPSITDPLRKLYKFASRRLSVAERGIIVFDEIDKLASNVPTEKDMKKGVQEELLGFISGGVYDFPLEEGNFASEVIHFDTSKITFILSGAFTPLRERKIRALDVREKNPIGFASRIEETPHEEKKKEYTITPQDYIDEGIHREFFGRIKVLTCTKGYNYYDFLNILNNSTISPIRNFEKTAEMYGYTTMFTMEFIDELCKRALAMNTGARGLQTIMSGVQNLLLYGMQNHEYDMDHPLELTPNHIDEYQKTLVRKI